MTPTSVPDSALRDLSFRQLVTADELAVLPTFERRIWGGESEMVSINILVATISEGGMAIGAFDGAGQLVGAVYGFATHEPDVLHSHYMAVEPAWRQRGLGRALKLRQRDWCLDHGITAMRWTFDPVQLNNAHLNINVLGAYAERYHVNHYGLLDGINGSLPSDRLTVRWQLAGEQPVRHETRTVQLPAVSADDVAAANEVAHTARLAYRAALRPLLDDGWLIVGVDRRGPSYTLAR